MKPYSIAWLQTLLAAALVLSLCSCTYFSQYDNRKHAEKLRLGMTKDEVLAVMGEPLRNQKYHRPDIWFYYIETRYGWDFQVTRDECLPIVFKNGVVVGWGKKYYYEVVEVTGRTGKETGKGIDIKSLVPGQ